MAWWWNTATLRPERTGAGGRGWTLKRVAEQTLERGDCGDRRGRFLLPRRTEMQSHLVRQIIFEGTRMGPLVGYAHLLQILDDRLALDFEFPC